MLKLQKRSEPFFDRKLFFSFCSTGHLKRSSDKLAEDFWPKVRKGLKRFIRKKTKFLPLFLRTQGKQLPTRCQKFPHNIRQNDSLGALEQLKFFSKDCPQIFLSSPQRAVWTSTLSFLWQTAENFPSNSGNFFRTTSPSQNFPKT